MFTCSMVDSRVDMLNLQEDLIGLRSLDERKGLVFTELPGFHMQFSDKNLVNDIIRPYLWNHTTVLS